MYRGEVESKFYSLIAHGTYVHHCAGVAGRRRDGGLQKQVPGVLQIPVRSELYAALNERKIQAHIPLFGGLPFEFAVGHIRREISGNRLAAEDIVKGILVAGQYADLRIEIVRSGGPVVSRHTPGCTQLTVGQPFLVLEPILTVEVPGKAG